MSPRWRRRLHVLLFLAAAVLLGSTAQQQLGVLARQLGTDWAERFGEQDGAMLQRIRRVGTVAIFAITAHPVGLLTPAHLAAGTIGLDARPFAVAVAVAVAVALAAPIRTIPFAFLGTAVLDLTIAQSLGIAGVLLLVFVLPLFSPRVRDWVRGGGSTRAQR